MFWDKAAGLYDFFETVYNGKVYKGTGKTVAEYINPTDDVLECACGTGMISVSIAPKCHTLIATDLSEGMMAQARKKCSQFTNTTITAGNILELEFGDNTFDKVVAGNVIHLLDNPEKAMKELERVCKPHGTIIIPTYINIQKSGETSLMVKTLEALGLSFKRQFDFTSYKIFFERMGYTVVEYVVVEGKMPCAIAVIRLES